MIVPTFLVDHCNSMTIQSFQLMLITEVMAGFQLQLCIDAPFSLTFLQTEREMAQMSCGR